jgi:hypothetical protein
MLYYNWVPLVEQELLTLQERLSSPRFLVTNECETVPSMQDKRYVQNDQ